MSLEVEFCGVRFPNPFIVASSPPTTTGEMIARAFEAGWGGAVIKTVPPEGELIENVAPRFAAMNGARNRIFGFENIELISERPLSVWEKECRILKDRYPDRVLIGSCMAGGADRAGWQELVVRLEDAGCDMVELNLGCPHGMPERGMGSVCSQNPEITGDITRWVSEVARKPFLVNLSPNVTEITVPGRAAARNGARALSAINTVNALLGVDIDRIEPLPSVDGKTSYGGYSGVAVRPIALKAVSDLARSLPDVAISGVGGIATWRDAVEFLLSGAATVQVCTEVMLRGFGIIGPMLRGLERYMAEHGFDRVSDMVGLALPRITDHGKLDFDYRPKAVIDESACIRCDACYTACEDAAYQAIEIPHRRRAPVKERGVPTVHLDLCTGCSLCQHVCPVDCIKMQEVAGAPREVKGFLGVSLGPDATYPGAARWDRTEAPPATASVPPDTAEAWPRSRSEGGRLPPSGRPGSGRSPEDPAGLPRSKTARPG